MNRSKFIALTAFIVFIGASAKAEDKAVSDTLLKELQSVVSTMIDDLVKGGTPLPPNVTAEKVKAQGVEQFKPFIMVTADEEARFKKGEFDDDGNKNRMDQFRKLFADLKVELPKVAVIFIEEHKNGKLSGVRLELAVRINQSVSDKVKQAMDRK